MSLLECSVGRRRLLAGFVLCSATATATAGAARAQSDPLPLRVTTDSVAYCSQLSDQVHQARLARRPTPVPRDVRLLTDEGRKMCDEGHVRPGILRLREALQILRGN